MEKELNILKNEKPREVSNQNVRELQAERNLIEEKNREMALEMLSQKSKAQEAESARNEIAEHMIMVQIDFNDKRNEFERKIFQLNRQINNLETEKNLLNSSKSVLENSVTQLKSTIDQLNKDILTMKKKPSSKSNNNNNNSSVQDIESIKLQYENVILTMRNKTQLLEEQNVNLKNLANELQESKARDQLEYQNLNQQIMQIQNKTKSGDDGNARFEEARKILENQISDLRQRLQFEQKEKQQLYEKLTNGVSNEILEDEVKKRIELEEKVRVLELEIATLKSTLDEFQSYDNYLDKDKGEINRIMRENEERLKGQLEQLKNKLTEMEQEKIKYESIVNSYSNNDPNSQSESIRQRFEEELKEERNRSRTEIDEWKEKYNEITNQLKTNEEKFSDFQLNSNSKIRSMELDILKVREENSLFQFQVETLKEVLVRIETESQNTASSSDNSDNSENCDFFTSQTFPPPTRSSTSTPPPPPPPPVSTSAPAPPPPPSAKDKNQLDNNAGSDRSFLLDQIKGGMKLKTVTREESSEDEQSSDSRDMLQALAKALISRRENLLEGADDEEDEEEDELWEED